ncbi:hypothetical protein Pla110_09430 [Polystyrenella longa]|uniref:DUF1570 domain-containing protein n=1 Tax=Polystyrenella longa TaxID=2528007 RepID=A0A518CJ64_9PLAN|nr:hypothetical protein [Polystyrenella longa]QDU79237.1 hypothetical protein Pla110_09430 [Polystyrenella longa]
MGWLSRDVYQVTHNQFSCKSQIARYYRRMLCVSALLLTLLTGCDNPSNSQATPSPDTGVPMGEPNPARLSPGQDLPSPTKRDSAALDAHITQEILAEEPVQFDNQTEPEQVYRPVDRRQVPDPGLLDQLGIHMVESKHIRLYSDLPVEQIESLPPLVDQLIAALEKYFGELPPDRDGKAFQLSGYIMQDVPLYEKSGLLPPKFAQVQHGRHQGAEFWIVVPASEYYLRHLLFHEATHCFMMYLPGTSAPVWYLEGMAELFGTHWLREDGSIEFNIFPESTTAYEGFGRIELIKLDIDETGPKMIEQVTNLESGGYHSNVSYAWAWALCSFFDQHPEYQQRFRHLSRQYLREEPFVENFVKEFAPLATRLNQEWIAMISELEYGMEIDRLAIDFTPGKPIEGAVEIEVAANEGWQNSRWLLEAGKTYRVQATGQFELDETTRPWTSTAEGISIDYYRGAPFGRLLGAIAPAEAESPEQNYCFAQFANFGKELVFRAPYTGTLHLRLNDRPDLMFDNKGTVQVRVEEVEMPTDESAR